MSKEPYIEVSDIESSKEKNDTFKVSGKVTAYFHMPKLMKITVDNCPVEYRFCSVHCNGIHYKECIEINYYNNSILVYKKDKKGDVIITKNRSLKRVRIYGKIKVFFYEVTVYEETDTEQEEKTK